MCRRLVAALYQVMSELNILADNEGRARQLFPEFVPDQFVVLYGIKSLAIKNINCFLYGVRAERMRKTADDKTEIEPILHFFWRASHHGVPTDDRLPQEDFDFYIDLLATVAKAVGDEHTLKMKGGAFWNVLGSMNEMQLPVFVLMNVLQKAYGTFHPELFERLKKLLIKLASDWTKRCKGSNPPKTCPSYKVQVIGSPDLDSRGHVPLEAFLAMSLEGAAVQREKDAKHLQAICQQWEKKAKGASFDMFAYATTAHEKCLLSA